MTRENTLRVIVVGGGAAGLVCAGFAAKNGCSVTVLERNDRPARKVMITGKGRCNLTNATEPDEMIKNVPGNGRFLYSAFHNFTYHDTMALVESMGVPLKIERGNRVFPISDKAVDVVDALHKFAKKSGAVIERARVQSLILENGACVGVVDDKGREHRADRVVVCTGGVSYPTTGSTGDGYDMARQAGHTVIEPRGSLVPLECAEPLCEHAQGLSLKNCGLTVVDTARKNKVVYTDFGEMLFTHFGVSGPMILSASAHLRDVTAGRYRLLIDLKPALSAEQLDARMLRDFAEMQNADLQNALPKLLPRSLVEPFLSQIGVDGETKCHSVTREQRETLRTAVKALPLTVTKPRPVAEAVVTAGGVSIKEVDPKTMASKLCEGLYFAGEVLDVDAYTGGFNLQIAFSTGAAAGQYMGIEEEL